MFGLGSAKVAPGQKVAQNQREDEAKRPFVIAWKKTQATIGETVKIEAVANIVVKNPSLIKIKILFNDREVVGEASGIVVDKSKITAEWKVKARNSGTHTEGAYSAQITYNSGVPALTAAPLKIVSNLRGGDYFG